MNKLRKLVYVSILALLLCTSCTTSTNINVPEDLSDKNSENIKIQEELPKGGEIYNYGQFVNIIYQLSENIEIPGFKLKNTPIVPNILILEKDLTFDKKDTLTIGGTVNDLDTTQQLFIYENSNQDTQIHIRLAYTLTDMGEELVSWDLSSGYQNTNQELSEKTDLVTLTYKNLIITVLQISPIKIDLELTKSVLRELIDSLKKIKINDL